GSDEDNFSFPLSHGVGSSGGPFNFPVTDGSAIPDGSPAGLTSTVVVSGLSGTISNVSAQVTVTHSWVGDIIITLQSPDGVVVTLLDRPGVPDSSTVGCNNNDIDVLFADGAPDPESVCTGTSIDAWPV